MGASNGKKNTRTYNGFLIVIKTNYPVLKFHIEKHIDHKNFLLTDILRGYRGTEEKYITIFKP